MPEHASDVVDLPSTRSSTQVSESEVVTTNAKGKSTVQSRESSYTQRSNDADGSDGSPEISRTVSNSEIRGKDGKLAKSSAASQTISMGETKLIDTWNDKGETIQQYSRSGLSEDGLDDAKDAAKDKKDGNLDDGPTVKVGERTIRLAPPGGESGLDRGRANDWLKDAPGDSVDLDVSVRRNAEGEQVGKTTTFSALDDNGNGRTATRTQTPKGESAGKDAKDPVEWNYTKLSNNGRDYDRQTSYEGSSVSTFEKHRETGPGQFKHTSETKDGDNVIANSEAERKQVTSLDELEGRLPAEQIAKLKQAGPPYTVETTSSRTELWKDKDGKVLRESDSCKPLQTESSANTLTVRNAKGYGVTENQRSVSDEIGNRSSENLSAVTDPKSKTPYAATIERFKTDAGTCEQKLEDRTKVSIDQKGEIRVNGERAASLDLGDSDFSEVLNKNPEAGASVLSTLNSVTGPIDQGAGTAKDLIDHRYQELGFDAPDYQKLKVLNSGAGILGLTTGAADIFSGLGEGGVEGTVKAIGGAGTIAGSLEGTALAASALPGRAGATATSATRFLGAGTAAKFLGKANGLGSLVVGGYDLFTGDSTEKRISGGLTAASGGLFIAAAASSGTIVGAPAGVVLAGAGVVTGAAGLVVGLFAPDESPAPEIDKRLGDS